MGTRYTAHGGGWKRIPSVLSLGPNGSNRTIPGPLRWKLSQRASYSQLGKNVLIKCFGIRTDQSNYKSGLWDWEHETFKALEKSKMNIDICRRSGVGKNKVREYKHFYNGVDRNKWTKKGT